MLRYASLPWQRTAEGSSVCLLYSGPTVIYTGRHGYHARTPLRRVAVRNVPDDKARAAAVEAAEFHNAAAEIKSTQRLHTWILGLNTAMIVAIVGKLFLGR
jgi:hypothetical protein